MHNWNETNSNTCNIHVQVHVVYSKMGKCLVCGDRASFTQSCQHHNMGNPSANKLRNFYSATNYCKMSCTFTWATKSDEYDFQTQDMVSRGIPTEMIYGRYLALTRVQRTNDSS